MNPPAASIPPSRPFLAIVGLDRSAAWHGLRLALAAWLAFCVATAIGLPNAFWAAMPVWVVAQNARGLLVERGIWRMVGSVAGAGLGFLLLATVPNHLALLTALGLWVALCAAGTHLIRGVMAYGVMLAGMTASVVILPALIVPEHATVLALSRVACTLIGVAMVTVVTGVFTPPAPRAGFHDELAQLGQEIAELDAPPTPAREASLLAGLVRLEIQLPLMLAGSWPARARARRERIESVLQAALTVLVSWRILATREPLPAAAHDPIHRQWIEARHRLAHARQTFTSIPSPSPAAPGLPMHRDWTRARYAALLAGGATWLAALLGMQWPGPEGELVALGVCIFSMVLCSLPLPQVVAPKLLLGVCIGVSVATAYRFLVQPYAHSGWLPLIATLAPFLVIGGLARASKRPWITLPALDANMCFMLASQASLPPANATAIVHGSLALMLAALVTTLGALALPERPRRHTDEAILRLRKAWQELTSTAIDTPHPALQTAHAAWRAQASRQTLRLAAHRHLPSASHATQVDLLLPLSLGQTAMALQDLAVHPELAAEDRIVLRQALDALRTVDWAGPPSSASPTSPATCARRIRALTASLPEPESGQDSNEASPSTQPSARYLARQLLHDADALLSPTLPPPR